MSEDEIVERHVKFHDDALYDLAVRYAGMGHVDVLVLHARTGNVFVDTDGGANAFERRDCLERRRQTDPSSIELRTFAAWQDDEAVLARCEV